MKKLTLLTLLALPCLCFSQVRFVIHKPFSGEPLFCNDEACLRKAKTARHLKSRRHKKPAVYKPHSTCSKQEKEIAPITQISPVDTFTRNITSLDSFQSTQILFSFDEYTLDSISINALNEVASHLLSNHVKRIYISGHTDSIGGLEYNHLLSLKRAETVKRYLTDKGIKDTLINISSWGFSQPLKNNATPENRSVNRRVDIRWIN